LGGVGRVAGLLVHEGRVLPDGHRQRRGDAEGRDEAEFAHAQRRVGRGGEFQLRLGGVGLLGLHEFDGQAAGVGNGHGADAGEVAAGDRQVERLALLEVNRGDVAERRGGLGGGRLRQGHRSDQQRRQEQPRRE
jgi:hypothetical protein